MIKTGTALRLAVAIALATEMLAAQDYASCARDPATLAACLREQAKLAKAPIVPSNLIPAGGKWTVKQIEDKLTGAKSTMFILRANESISDGMSQGRPEFQIVCAIGVGLYAGKPEWNNSALASPIVLGSADSHSAVSNAPQQTVTLRTDGKSHIHEWNIAGDYKVMFVDRGATKQFLSAVDARIQFADASEHAQVALFSPAGLDRTKLETACGAKTFK